jgi:hydrogenase expression/formation protein HypC
MCLAIPMKLISIDGEEGTIESNGVSRTVNLCLTPEAREGDYLLVHTGYALNVLDAEEAAQTLALMAEIAAHEDPGEKP